VRNCEHNYAQCISVIHLLRLGLFMLGCSLFGIVVFMLTLLVLVVVTDEPNTFLVALIDC
jgi:hypothetical protein